MDIRNDVVETTIRLQRQTGIAIAGILGWLGITSSKYYDWVNRQGSESRHNGAIPKSHWLTQDEQTAILTFYEQYKSEGYRRLAWMMVDLNIAHVSPSSVYRILKKAGKLQRWNTTKASSKKKGFDQPTRPHEHWHVDISYIKIQSVFYYLICVLDGYSRFIVHFELRESMTEFDVQITLQRAHERYPHARPRIISDNGSQFICRDFLNFVQMCNFTHVRTSVNYPQSNGKIERFHKSIKHEHVRQTPYFSLQDAQLKMAEWIAYYNHERLHSAISYLTPFDMLSGQAEEKLEQRRIKLAQAAKKRKEKNREINYAA